MKRAIDPEARAALDEWADKVAALGTDVIRLVIAYAGRLAADRRLKADDRRFAASQAGAVRRAVRRAKHRKTNTVRRTLEGQRRNLSLEDTSSDRLKRTREEVAEKFSVPELTPLEAESLARKLEGLLAPEPRGATR